jgi:hypothetical protein
LDIDLVAATGIQNLFAQGVLTDEAGGEKRKGSARPGEVDQNVIGRAAGALGLATNVRELFWLRVDINHLDQVDDPVAAGEQAGAGGCAFLLHHNGKTVVWALVNEKKQANGKRFLAARTGFPVFLLCKELLFRQARVT